MQFEFVAPQRLVQLPQQGKATHAMLVRGDFIEGPVLSEALGLVHGNAGILQQRECFVPMLREAGYADVGANTDRNALELEGPTNGITEIPDHLEQPVPVALAFSEDGKTIAIKAADQAASREHVFESISRRAKHGIARIVAEGVIYLLEAGEVQYKNRHRLQRGIRQPLGNLFHEQETIGQPGQGIMSGLVPELRFLLAAFAQVAEYQREMPAFIVFRQGCGDFHRNACTILRPNLGFQDPAVHGGKVCGSRRQHRV